MINIAVVDPDPQFAEEIELLIQGRSDMSVVAVAFDLNRAFSIIEKNPPKVIVIGPGMGDDISIMFAKRLTAEYPIGCIVMTFDANYNLKIAAKKANIVDVIQIPVDPDKIINAIQTAAGFAEQLTIAKDIPQLEEKCPVITIFSTKGGVGKTVLASNVGTSIAKKTDYKVVVVDLDLQFGDIGIALGLEPDVTILDVMDHIMDVNAGQIEKWLMTHKSGLKTLLAPKEPESADLIKGEHVSVIIETLRRYADFVIVDTPASFNDNVLAVLDVSDEICIVLNMDMPGVKNIKLCLKTLKELNYSFDKQKLVINKVESNVGLKVSQIEKVLGMRAIAAIPSDKAVPLSINKGIPVVLDSPKLQVSKDIEYLADYYLTKYKPEWKEALLAS